MRWWLDRENACLFPHARAIVGNRQRSPAAWTRLAQGERDWLSPGFGARVGERPPQQVTDLRDVGLSGSAAQ